MQIDRVVFGDLEGEVEAPNEHKIALHLAGLSRLEQPHLQGGGWKSYFPKRGDLSFSPAASDSRFRNSGAAELLKLSIPLKTVETALEETNCNFNGFTAIRDPLFERLMLALADIPENVMRGRDPYREGICHLIVLHLVRVVTMQGIRQSQGLSSWRLKRALDFLESRIPTGFMLEEIATEVGLTPSYFSTQFKASFGCGPHRYFIALRMERARHLLLTTAMSVAEVAASLGFRSHSYFGHRFQAYFGQPPATLRSLHKKR